VTISPMLCTAMRIGVTAGGAAAGYYLIPGTRKERMLQAVIGGAAGYLVSGAVSKMMPVSAPTEISGGASEVAA